MVQAGSPWSHSMVESMSTAQLCSALRSADSPAGTPSAVRPSRDLLAKMVKEWDERPTADRVAAEALLDHRLP